MVGGVHSSPVRVSAPQRTCVGCRGRADVTDLIRVVAVAGSARPDPSRRLPGRGAHLHLNPQCLSRAQRSRGLERALRVEGSLDLALLRQLIGER